MRPEFRREKMRRLTEEEIRAELKEQLDKLPPPVTVVFANQEQHHANSIIIVTHTPQPPPAT